MINFISIFLISISILLVILYIKKSGLIIEHTQNDPRKIHDKEVTRIGGFIFTSLLYYLLINSFEKFNFPELDINTIVIYSFIIFSIGFYEDITNSLSYKIRVFLLIITIFIFVVSNNFHVYDFDHKIIDSFINSSIYLTLFFSILSIFLLVNGFNIIDGLNGLAIGVSIIILLNISYLSFNSNDFIFLLSTSLLIPSLLLFAINFCFGEILLGDGGSYFLGFLISTLCIVSSQYNIIHSFHIACIVFYPAFEIFFTFLRRIAIDKSSPFLPDEKHLHLMFFTLIKNFNIINKKSNTFKNSASSFIILFIFTIINLFMLIFRESINFSLLFILLIFLYLVIYFFIRKLFISVNK